MRPAFRVMITADAVGGVWTYARDLARALSDRGVQPVLARLGPASPAGPEGDPDGIEVIETKLPLDWLAEGPAEVTSAGPALARLAAARGIDLLHLNSPALAAGVPFPMPVVGGCHSCLRTWWDAVRGGDLPEDFRWRTDLLAEGYAACDALLAPTRAFAEATAAAYGLKRAPIVVHNGRGQPVTRPDHDVSQAESLVGNPEPPHPEVPIEDRPRRTHSGRACFEGRLQRPPQHEEGGRCYRPPGSEENGVAEPPHGEEGGAFILTAGRLWDDGKNLALLDRVAARLPAPVLAAGATAGPNGAAIDLRHVRPVGFASAADLAALYRRRPVFASLALYEPFGLAVLEAAQHGCALVLSDIATFRELWEGAALFVPFDEAEAAQAIGALLSDPGRIAALGQAARERARRYTVGRMADETLALYRDVLAAGRPALARAG